MVFTLLVTLGFVSTVDDGLSTPALFYVHPCNLQRHGVTVGREKEQQASQMRDWYLIAVLRQDVEYFGLNANTITEVITSITNDSLVIQDYLSEKMSNFIMNDATFIGCYAMGFFLPIMVLLVIPGIIYGCILMELARKMQRM
ncbi:hypothetical protein ZIOFF_068628 [Zingiber officinale]|uniref:ABC transmembrane type-1 domain-containing protein n=1 Tax=Zingiber officinale TaxID=94328 RepID=A0A8J5CET8_ZINOF|nr:hypothetical protein ZIOFF_068628 [Zingiber officinale]